LRIVGIPRPQRFVAVQRQQTLAVRERRAQTQNPLWPVKSSFRVEAVLDEAKWSSGGGHFRVVLVDAL